MIEETKKLAPFELLSRSQKWKLLLIDEEEEVHVAANDLLKSFVYQGKSAELISATDIEIAEVLIEQNTDLAVILLGKLSQSDRATHLLQYTRSACQNHWTRILNCTGQPKDITDPELLKGLQGFMGHGVLGEVRLLTFITSALKSFEEAIYASSLRGGGLSLPESAGRGAVTIFRWKNFPGWPVEFVSLNVRALLGYSAEELIQGVKSYTQLVFSADLERVEGMVKEYSEAGVSDITQEYRLITQAGRVIWVFDATKVLRNEQGEVTHYISYITDITEKKEQERLLFEKEIFGVLQMDLACEIHEANDIAADLLRIEPLQAQGQKFFDWVSKESFSKVEGAFKRASQSGQPERLEVPIQTKAGVSFCRLTITMMQNAVDDAVGFLVILEDLSEMRKVEEDLRRSLASEKAFIASVSHEMRTPLSSILGYTDFLLASPGLRDEQRQFAENIALNSQHLVSLINDILDISKIESNQLSLNLQEVVFGDIFTACGVMVSSKLKEGVRLDVQPIDFTNYIKCDPIRIKQIFVNLLSNAAKFTNQGKISIYVQDMTSIGENLLSLRVCVKDTGIGIGKEKQKELFQPFKQAHIGEYGGTGLGLYLSRRIAQLMDGDITVESDLGKGSRFIVELVLAKGRLKEADFDFAGRRLLVIGDYPSLSEPQKRKILDTGAFLRFIDAHEPGRTLFQEILDLDLPEVALLDLDILKERSMFVAGVLRECHPEISVIGLKTKTNLESNELVDQTLLRPFSYFQLGKAIKKSLLGGGDAKSEDFSQLKVLMGEDADANRQLYAQMFKRFFKVELDLAVNGREAVKKVKTQRYDLVLMDIQMPELDGIEATKEIRKFDASIPIIAMTGSLFAEDVRNIKEAGMNDYLPKPVQKEDILKLLRSIREVGGVPNQLKMLGVSSEELALVLEKKQMGQRRALTGKMREFLETIGSPEEVQEEILSTAVREISEGFAAIRKSYAEGSKKALSQELHKLKGLMSNINLQEQGNLIQDIEILSKQGGDVKLLKARMEQLFSELAEFE